MTNNIDTNTFRSISIVPDGNCQYRSISYSLSKSQNLYKRIKQNVIKYIIEHKDIFSNYIYDMTFEEYIDNISEENEWGNEVTLLAASLYLGIEINVYDKNTNAKISTYNELPNESTDKKIYLYYDNLMMHYDAIEIIDINDVIQHMDNLNIDDTVEYEYNAENYENTNYKIDFNDYIINKGIPKSVSIITDKYNLYRTVAYCLCKREDLHKEIIKRVYRNLIDNEEIKDKFINIKDAGFITTNDHIMDYILDDITYEELIKGFAKHKIFPDNNILRLISLEMKLNIIIYKKDTNDIIKKYMFTKNHHKTIKMFYDEITSYYNAIDEDM